MGALDSLRDAKDEDTVMLFIPGHGVTTSYRVRASFIIYFTTILESKL
jgi:uncharacterized caspase-like protein